MRRRLIKVFAVLAALSAVAYANEDDPPESDEGITFTVPFVGRYRYQIGNDLRCMDAMNACDSRCKLESLVPAALGSLPGVATLYVSCERRCDPLELCQPALEEIDP